MNNHVLIIDDEPNARAGLRRVLEGLGCVVRDAGDGAEGLALFRQHGADLIMTDLRMPGASGMTVLETVKKEAPDIPVILITAYGTGDAAREALQKGAYDFISKPFDSIEAIELVTRRALKLLNLEQENESLKPALSAGRGIEGIIGASPQMAKVLDMVRQVAPTKANVLIEGESGTGKELVARAVHGLSGRKAKAFMPVHCASFSEHLLESELFGHEKGSFTGATGLRRGRFELADGGTLFLDEVSTIALPVQVKLLRVLQERHFERVGGSETIEVDVRLIAATNSSLEAMIKSGTFREDLYYRLNVVTIKVPPLRDRRGDIPLLTDYFLEKSNREAGKSVGIAKVAREILDGYAWPGNVRELGNTVEALVVLCDGRAVTPRDLPTHIVGQGQQGKTISTPDGMPDMDTMTLTDMEKWMIMRKVGMVKTRAEAARQLGISRRNLYRRLREYGALNEQ